MKPGFVLLLLICVPCWSQTTTGKAETTGPCSPAVTGSNNQFKITCQGISDRLGAQLVDLLNKVAKNQGDTDAMMAKLDGCLVEQQKMKETLGGWKLGPDAQSRLIEMLKPFAGTHFVLTANPNEANFMGTIDNVLEKAGWTWQQPASDNPLFVELLGGKASVSYVSGFYIFVPRDRMKDLGAAGEALLTGLQKEGVPMKGYAPEKVQYSNAIQVFIGKRE